MSSLEQPLKEYDPNMWVRKGQEANITCPMCGHSASKEQAAPHCEVNIHSGRWYCFSCGEGGSCHLTRDGLAFIGNSEQRVFDSTYALSPEAIIQQLKTSRDKSLNTQDKTPSHPWITNPSAAAVCLDLDAWQKYEPAIRLKTLCHFTAGTSRPFNTNNEPLLTYAVKNRKKAILGFRYRSKKWKSLAGLKNTLFNSDDLQPGCIVVIGESPVAAMLGWQEYAAIDDAPIVFVAPTNGANSWRDEWSLSLWRTGVKGVVLAFDNDDAGQRAASKLAECLAINGIKKIKNYEWPHNYPKGFDLRDLISQDIITKRYHFGEWLADTLAKWESTSILPLPPQC